MSCVRGNDHFRVMGTGFFVGVSDSRLPAGSGFVYVVTNRHLAMCWDDERNPMRVQIASIRMNLKDGTSKEVPNLGNVPWIVPADESIDLALTAVNFDSAAYEYRIIPESLLIGDEEMKKEPISEGLKILFSGFFYQVPGLTRLEPILREGTLAMIPDEDLMTTTGKMGKLYLGEVHAFHGNSGSPVFVDLRSRGGIGFDYRLLGIVSGGYSEGEENRLVLETPLADKPGNSGVAMIVPASQLKALLYDPRVVAQREAQIANQPRK
jgi:hypothetical protein